MSKLSKILFFITPNFVKFLLQNLPRRGRPRKSLRDFRVFAEVSQKFTCMSLCKPLRRKIYSNAIFGMVLMSGCAAAPGLIPFDTAVTQGMERVYDFPYKKVFYAADAAANGMGEFIQLYTKESNFEKGFIRLNGGMPAVRVNILVEKTGDIKTFVKVTKYTKVTAEYLRNNFFQNLERLLKDN